MFNIKQRKKKKLLDRYRILANDQGVLVQFNMNKWRGEKWKNCGVFRNEIEAIQWIYDDVNENV